MLVNITVYVINKGRKKYTYNIYINGDFDSYLQEIKEIAVSLNCTTITLTAHHFHAFTWNSQAPEVFSLEGRPGH